MKKIIFFVFGAAVGFILGGFAASNVSGDGAIVVLAVATLLGGAFGTMLAGRATKEIESQSTPGLAKIVIWILVIAIMVVAVVAFLGLNM